jgi:hypothetical protein
MTAVDMLRNLMTAQLQAQLALGAAIEELAIWARDNGGAEAAGHARDALGALDGTSALVLSCIELLEAEAGAHTGAEL